MNWAWPTYTGVSKQAIVMNNSLDWHWVETFPIIIIGMIHCWWLNRNVRTIDGASTLKNAPTCFETFHRLSQLTASGKANILCQKQYLSHCNQLYDTHMKLTNPQSNGNTLMNRHRLSQSSCLPTNRCVDHKSKEIYHKSFLTSSSKQKD